MASTKFLYFYDVIFYNNYLNNGQDQSAETPECHMMGPEEGQEASAIEG